MDNSTGLSDSEMDRITVFNYRTLRRLMGLIALLMPIIVVVFAGQELSSISASYYTNARDIFVGMFFIVGAFFCAYNGGDGWQKKASKLAALAAILVALFPTSEFGQGSLHSTVHFTAAFVLFVILIYFCFGFFRADIKAVKGPSGKNEVRDAETFRLTSKGKQQGDKERLRSGIYLTCGWIMVASIVVAALSKIFLSEEMVREWALMFWAETAALEAFGVAWITAGKFGFLQDKGEA